MSATLFLCDFNANLSNYFKFAEIYFDQIIKSFFCVINQCHFCAWYIRGIVLSCNPFLSKILNSAVVFFFFVIKREKNDVEKNKSHSR